MSLTHPIHLSQHLKRLARRAAGAHDNCPVQIVDGAKPLCEERGDFAYFTTPGGKRIDYPNAYRWPKVYHPSTRHVAVTVAWLEWASRLVEHTADGVTVWVAPRGKRIHGFRVRRCILFQRLGYLVEGRGWTYHANIHEERAERLALRRALASRRVQLDADRAALAERKDLERVWLTVEDAHAGGACQPGTEAARKRVVVALGGDVGAVRADVALEILKGEETWVRRAVAAAQSRVAA